MGSFFLRPETLFWLAPLAALPILIHLLNRRRYRQVNWAAMEFLRRAFERTRRRVRLENLILLILRVAALSLLCLALARPFVGEKSPLAALAQSKRNVVMLLDTSYSMGYDDFGSCFERAKERAKKLLDELEPERGDTVSIVLVSDRVDVPIEAALDVKKAREEFERMEVGFGKSDLLAGVRETSRIVKKLQTNQEVYFFTDLRARDWIPSEAADGSRTALSDALAELPVRVTVVDCGTEATKNLAIVRLAAEERLVCKGTPVLFQADVRNFGPDEVSFDLEVWVGDARVQGPPPQSVPPGETRSVPFTHTFDLAGPAALRVQIGNGDSLRADDVRWIALDVRDAARVLVVDGKVDAPRLERPSGLFVYALDPGFGEESDEPADPALSLFSITEVGDYQFATQDFDRYDLVVLADVDVNERTFPPASVAALRDRVERGGALLVFAGENVVIESYNNVFRGGNGDSLLPAELLEKRRLAKDEARGGTRLRIPRANLEQPLVKRLLKQEDFAAAIERPAVYTWIACRPDPHARPLLVFQDDAESPAIVEGSVGKGTGRTVFVATSANGQPGGHLWNELPNGYPEYLVLMNEIVLWLMSEDPSRRNPTLNEPILRTFPRFIGDLALTRPDGERSSLQVRILEGGRGASVAYAETDEPGVYELRSSEAFSADEAAGVAGYDLFCVNVDAAEGDVARTNEGHLRTVHGQSFDFTLEADAAKTESGPLRGEGELWRHIAFAVLVLIFLETFLAQKFGDYARKRN